MHPERAAVFDISQPLWEYPGDPPGFAGRPREAWLILAVFGRRSSKSAICGCFSQFDPGRPFSFPLQLSALICNGP